MRFIQVDPSKILQRAKDRIPNLVGVKHTSKEVRKVYNSSLVDSSRFQVLMGTEAVIIINASEILNTLIQVFNIIKLLYILLNSFLITVLFSHLNIRNSYLIFPSALISRWLCHTWEHYSTTWRRPMILGTNTQHWRFK